MTVTDGKTTRSQPELLIWINVGRAASEAGAGPDTYAGRKAVAETEGFEPSIRFPV
jgi:hypothetical protein